MDVQRLVFRDLEDLKFQLAEIDMWKCFAVEIEDEE